MAGTAADRLRQFIAPKSGRAAPNGAPEFKTF